MVKLKSHLLEQLSAYQPEVVGETELTLVVAAEHLLAVSQLLRDAFAFDVLIDVCGVDYLEYGCYEWSTEQTSHTGFSRACDKKITDPSGMNRPRFAVVYHLLSVQHNQRLRMKVWLHEHDLMIDSVCPIWAAADWFEREAYDLFGIIFKNHPDLRRILTDYGFIGHPFRKDFPLSGQVEVRYDSGSGRVVYEPVDIEPRVLVPKVFRNDNRYSTDEVEAADG